jgi:hypothetical protein
MELWVDRWGMRLAWNLVSETDAEHPVLESGDSSHAIAVEEGERFALRTNAHLSDDKAIAKMGHPDFGVVRFNAHLS